MINGKKFKIGLVGLGNIGAGTHARILKDSKYTEVVGVCDIVKDKADQIALELDTTAYYNYLDLFEHSALDAVIIAVPHYIHTPVAIEAFNRGLHVLCEKPVAVHVNDAHKMMEAYERASVKNPKLIYALGFQERTLPFHKKIKDIVDSGELGKLLRVTWINTAWFRSQAYYDSSDWRATWVGEGGGILINQCPHNLDLYQWLFGVPDRISGFVNIGKYHDIEVEDEVTAYFEHNNGMIGHFIVNTAETPGTNRLEIVGEFGNLVYEKDALVFYRNRKSMFEFSKESKESFGKLECWYTEIPVNQDQPCNHPLVFDRFAQAVLNGGGELIAHGSEGVKSLIIANAIMLSSFTKRAIEIPFDAVEYENKLEELKKDSKHTKKVQSFVSVDMSASFTK